VRFGWREIGTEVCVMHQLGLMMRWERVNWPLWSLFLPRTKQRTNPPFTKLAPVLQNFSRFEHQPTS
jgi:hypothetical protein